MGVHRVVDHHQPLDQALAAIDVPNVKYVVLTGTARHLPAIAAVIAPQGHVAVIDDPDVLDIVPFKRKAVSICWEFMFTRSMFETEDMVEQGRILNKVSALIDAGVPSTTLTETSRPINAAGLIQLHARLESVTAIGKSVLRGI